MVSAPTTTAPGATVSVVVLVFGGPLTSDQILSLRNILAGLTNLPLAAFSVDQTSRRMATYDVSVTSVGSEAAGNSIATKLTEDPDYLTSQDPNMPRVDNASGPGVAAGKGLSGGAIAGIVVGSLVGAALIVLLLICLVKKTRGNKMMRGIKSMRPNHVAQYENDVPM